MSETKLKSWLKGQLTNVKQKEQPWIDLVEAFAELLSKHVEGYLERLSQRNSLYDMSKEDLLEETKELRKIFPITNNNDEDLVHSIVQRIDEIHFKKTIYPMLSTIAREFNGMKVEWVRLFAPVDQEAYPYGSLFVQEDQLNDYVDVAKEDFFLTSRGVIRIHLNVIRETYGDLNEESLSLFEENIRKVVYPLIPLTIVCDGQVYYLSFNLFDFIEKVTYKDAYDDYLSLNDETEQTEQTSSASVSVSTEEGQAVTPIRARPRMGAVAFDAIPLDRVYY